MRAKKCPICGAKIPAATHPVHPDFPFCSARCKQIDLGRWLSEKYPIPVETERVFREVDQDPGLDGNTSFDD
jgi:endogenous inhibitor of DNA gyrase (YacG/DUF329 family)